MAGDVTVQLTLTIPGAVAQSILTGFQLNYDKLQGENDLAYVKRLIGLILTAEAKRILKAQAANAAANQVADPGILIT